ncbi:MAG: nucleotidyltransferase domain-containing protein [Spirochaetes bacterium]|nr:nucleotidyltransferase domain-containing protein [Spirochaetota bacterium]
MDIIEKLRAENVEGITKAIDLIIHYARRHDEVEKVILFGSTARGKMDALSDLDILVVMNTEKDFHHRNIDMRMHIKAPVDIDIICLRPDELEQNRNRPFYRHILNEGKTIYAK